MSFNKTFSEAFQDEKLSDRMLPSFILVRNMWLEGIFNLIESFTDYNHKLGIYRAQQLEVLKNKWLLDLTRVYLYFRSQLIKEVNKNPKNNKYSEMVSIMEGYILRNGELSFNDGRIATLLLNDFAHEIGLTEVTNERKDPKSIMKTPY